jgi:hypothetical protein
MFPRLPEHSRPIYIYTYIYSQIHDDDDAVE